MPYVRVVIYDALTQAPNTSEFILRVREKVYEKFFRGWPWIGSCLHLCKANIRQEKVKEMKHLLTACPVCLYFFDRIVCEGHVSPCWMSAQETVLHKTHYRGQATILTSLDTLVWHSIMKLTIYSKICILHMSPFRSPYNMQGIQHQIFI